MTVSAQAAGPATPSVAFFGDSIGHDAQGELRDQLSPLYRFQSHTEDAADVPSWTDEIATLARSPGRPHTLLIELGTADAGWDHSTATFEADVRTLLDVASPQIPCIRWFDLRAEPSLYRYVLELRARGAVDPDAMTAAADVSGGTSGHSAPSPQHGGDSVFCQLVHGTSG